MPRPARFRPCARVLLLGATLVAGVANTHAQQDTTDAARLVDALEVRPGMRVAEIGAGAGVLTVAMAKAVGTSGHVFSNEIDRDRHAAIRAAIAEAGLGNVTVVESGPDDANLPASCCDALFMRNVYHHFDDPAAMTASLFRAMRPGARIAVIDFPPRSGQEAEAPADRDQGNAHGVTTTSIERELQGAGFELVATEQQRGDRWFMVVARKPDRR